LLISQRVNADSFDGMSYKVIPSTLADQFFSKAYRLIGKRGQQVIPFAYNIFDI
jgi:hypothetical protein